MVGRISLYVIRFTEGCDFGVGGGPYFQRCQIDRAILAWYVSERRCHGPAGAYPGTDETAIDQGRSKQVLKAPDRAVDQNSAIVFEIGRAHVRTPVTNAHLVCRLLL